MSRDRRRWLTAQWTTMAAGLIATHTIGLARRLKASIASPSEQIVFCLLCFLSDADASLPSVSQCMSAIALYTDII
jgi:hypothetical protein